MKPSPSLSSLILLLIFITTGCKLQRREESFNPNELLSSAYTGFNINGHAVSCTAENTSTCSGLPPGQEVFKNRCIEQDAKVFQCNCQYILCGKNIFKNHNDRQRDKKHGYDQFGKQRSCLPMNPKHLCTTVVTPADTFAAQCKQAGAQATKCACHDYICSKKLN